MKKLLTIITDEKPETEETVPDEIEILHTDGKFTHDIFKAAKGKYVLLAKGDLVCEPTPEFFTALDMNRADILSFDGSELFRPAVLKNVPQKYCTDKYSAEIFAVYGSTSVVKASLRPFSFKGSFYVDYSAEGKKLVYNALDEFIKIKSKLNKEVYSFSLDFLCRRLTEFYASAILAVHAGNASADEIKEIDAKLKETPVLNVTFCKRFSACNLQRLREKNYKINFFTANKLKRILK